MLGAVVLPSYSGAQTASALLEPRSGSVVSGFVKLTQTNDGVLFEVTVTGLRPGGAHGFHVHQGTDCDSPDASSAGPHFNPKVMPHGYPNSAHSHAGDLPNLVARDNGQVSLLTASQQVSLKNGSPDSIVGRTLVVHAEPDDHTTQPAGNAGVRIACGVVRPSQ